ncbi:molybdopterin-containing oxidoreductase II, DMSO/TMAO/BSO reductase family, monoheme c-type cytochrome [Campylobacter pinnipediorum subsp. caledonicus]|uniref:Molybdopterin-containing oxidoreductase II, DMSO/TMAO/BSO reductase family, monoheme c-type cytochrome n=1 Tax=Campylobacter pinnipediorum subsp. caledonicus TaxID=1874362 RepID=A0A1S6U9I3_9BACT|nr:cytochrome C [Campylobacter pinnipediorum]AQW86736.1 molybdopterin-containing oxidoreductase II, DMSO/TMAO/BSO reductase family, monoheme c-type cytochrome [Campylobacter pinnipediorum subsp. caledonicus]AQW88391.1 molybdopterin-containing oxidoreductase II, DMSO/TMAO/BSO reductase family, monoheme c-type cytochrome [Campylobacter pinnipediorum subsp. caledonicus]OPA72639.1 cytochrome C [Campylobacter pinnipediorum subsp. caledonicus]
MKKLLLSSLLICFSYANSEVYTDVVKPVFADTKATKSIGRLLPTNGVKILEKNKDILKLEVQGYQNPDVKNVIYFNNSERIFTLALSKTAKIDIKVIEEGKNGKWNLVKTEVFAKDGGFSSDLQPIFNKAKNIYENNCGTCHSLHKPTSYKANQWPSLLKSMLSRTAIDKKDEWLVIQYLQKNASDKNAK